MARMDLRTPAGMLALIGVTFLAAVGLAVGAVWQRPWFEKFVREKYGPVSATASNLGVILDDSPEKSELVRALPPAERDSLYEGWVQAGAGWPAAAPAAMTRADPDFFLARAWRTWICGSDDQKKRALVFLENCGNRRALGLLERACRQANARRAASLESLARQALEGCRRSLSIEDTASRPGPAPAGPGPTSTID